MDLIYCLKMSVRKVRVQMNCLDVVAESVNVFSKNLNNFHTYVNIRLVGKSDMDGNSDVAKEAGKENYRLAEYKKPSIACDQENRRRQLLQNQKRRREDVFNAFRNITDFFSDSGNEFEEDEVEEGMDWVVTKVKSPRLKNMLMFSEWMVAVPESFEEKWLFVVCPVGKRCLVYCTKGFTLVFGKKGNRLAKFQSALPNGSQGDSSKYRYSNSEVTILDCIWDSQSKAYFILDLLSWKGQIYMNTETSFRAFWIKSKIEEIPNVLERSEKNPFPFLPLDYNSCNSSNISSVLSVHQDEPKIDGLLFYHSETHYTPGFTPLVLWLKPFMLPEIINITLPEKYTQMKPSSYINMNDYIIEFEEKRNKKKKFRRNKKMQEMHEEVNEDMEV